MKEREGTCVRRKEIVRECCKGLGMKYVIVWAKTSQYSMHNFLNWNSSEKNERISKERVENYS